MLKINLLKNNIPSKIDIPKKHGSFFVKFLLIFLIIIFGLFFAVFSGFQLAKRQIETKTKTIEKPFQTKVASSKKEKKITQSNTFNITVNLQNATSNQTQVSLESQTSKLESKKEITAIAPRHIDIPKSTSNKLVSKPHRIYVSTKNCIVSCSDNQLNELKLILRKNNIKYTIQKIENPAYYYVIYVGGLEKPEFLDFENALKLKGYNVVGAKLINNKYYANLGKMDKIDKDKFMSAWKNLGFDILVDKHQELSNKKYEARFSCTKGVFEELSQKGFDVKTGRGAAW